MRDQHRAEQHEASISWMNEAAVNSQPAEAGRLSDPLMRDDPTALGKIVELHRKRHRRVQRAKAHAFETPHDAARNLIDLMPGSVKLEVSDRAGR